MKIKMFYWKDIIKSTSCQIAVLLLLFRSFYNLILFNLYTQFPFIVYMYKFCNIYTLFKRGHEQKSSKYDDNDRG